MNAYSVQLMIIWTIAQKQRF